MSVLSLSFRCSAVYTRYTRAAPLVDQPRHPPARAVGRPARPGARRLQRADPWPGHHRRRRPAPHAHPGRAAVPHPADPTTWAAVQACLDHRDRLTTLNPHVIVTNATRAGDAPADGSYLTCRLAPAGTTPSACRQTRIAQLVNDLDPKLTAATPGLRDG